MTGAGGRWTSLGHRALATYLAAANTTARQLARDCGVSEAAVSLLRTGRTRYPDLPTADALERKTGIRWRLWLKENHLLVANLSVHKRPRCKLHDETPDEGEQGGRRHGSTRYQRSHTERE